MKKTLIRVLTGTMTAGLMLALAGLIYGNDAWPGDKGGYEKGVTAYLLDMKDKIGLTGAQTEKLMDLRDNEKKEMAPLFERTAADIKTLVDKVKAGADDEELKAVLDKLSDDRQNIETARKKYTDSVRDILTPAQESRIVIAMSKHDKWRIHKDKNIKDRDESDE